MHFYLPAAGPDDWRKRLAKPEKHWRIGYSARTLAHCWHASDGFPPEVAAALNQSRQLALDSLEPLLAIPEHQVALPGSGKASQTDLWYWRVDRQAWSRSRLSARLTSPSVLAALTGRLGLAQPLPGALRYQLLHRTASAILEAQRFGAGHAVMLVHSFSATRPWFDDFSTFAELFGVLVAPDAIVNVGMRSGVELSLGWIGGDARFREA
jgi:hypothetical protein